MSDTDFPLARFTISDAAKREIENIRVAYDAVSDDRADTIMIGWGEVRPRVGSPYGCVIVSFYSLSQRPDIAHGIQHVSGLPIIFFTTAKYAPLFDGKVVDVASDLSFFLRDP